MITVTALVNNQLIFMEQMKRLTINLTKFFELPIGRLLIGLIGVGVIFYVQKYNRSVKRQFK